jgi:large subunit ribosomal protein L18
MAREKNRRAMRVIRHERIRGSVSGSEARPRLAVFRSSRHIYAQLINDESGKTLASVNTMQADLKGSAEGKKPVEVARLVGVRLAEKAKEAGVNTAVFDRGGFKYHGRVKALADGAREAGLEF